MNMYKFSSFLQSTYTIWKPVFFQKFALNSKKLAFQNSTIPKAVHFSKT